MTKDNTVIFKGGKEGIVVLLDENADFERICLALRRKVKEARKFFADAHVSLTFRGKELSDQQILELLEIINAETELSITFVEDLTGQLQVAETMTAPEPEPIGNAGSYFHRGSLRSGQAIIQNGSVVVMGDVNAGAEISATGSVVVMGTVRGLIIAGSQGDENAYIVALSLQPHQFLSIAGKKVHYTKEMLIENKAKQEPEYVFLKDGSIHIDFLANMK